MSVEGAKASRFARLTSMDGMFLRLESAAWPCHFGGLTVVEGKSLLDGSGQLRLHEIRERLDRRVARIPKLRQRVYFPGVFKGKPLWVDDNGFDIQHHIYETAVDSPGGDSQLLETAAQVYGALLNRSRPLWELWFMTGLSDGRVGVLLKLHHAVADGLAAVEIMGSLFDFEPDAPDPVPSPWVPAPIPPTWSLLADNFSEKIRRVRHVSAMLAHPVRLARGARRFARMTRRFAGQVRAPRTSINQVVRVGRRVRFLRLELAAMKKTAHAHEGKVNDIVLDLWAGGLCQLMLSRGEATAGVELITSVPVSLRSSTQAGTIDNESGVMVLPLPVWEADVQRRLDLIVHTTRKTKAEQRPAAIAGFMAGLAATPLGRYYTIHQQASNVLVTNVVGPPVPVYLLGARILDILPIIQLVGNIGLTLCAFSYAGQVYLVVTADASSFPDLDVLMAGMEKDWRALIGSKVPEPVQTR